MDTKLDALYPAAALEIKAEFADEPVGGVLPLRGLQRELRQLSGSGSHHDPRYATRVRIGLAHGGEDSGAREDAEFDAYILRIEHDGDVVAEADDVATVESKYGDKVLVLGSLRGNDELEATEFITSARQVMFDNNNDVINYSPVRATPSR